MTWEVWRVGLTACLVALCCSGAAGQNYVVNRLTTGTNNGSTVAVNTQLHLPTDVDFAPGIDDYIFISQLGGVNSDGSDGDDVTKKEGRIVLFNTTTGQVDYNNPFLVINDTDLLDPYGVPEVGLFSTAFHPDFATNGKFYVSVAVDYPGSGSLSLAPRDPRTSPFTVAVREYMANPTNLAAGATFSRTILQVNQPAPNHNGSWLGFSPLETADGKHYLYATFGDGGDQHDPQRYGQDLNSLLGTVVRVDIDADSFPSDPSRNYAIPADNPFVGTTALPEIWAYGLRNPWRASFDSLTGDMYIGDVGQNIWEEIDFIPADIAPGDPRNFGWRLREGFVATPTGGVGGAAPADNVDPIIAYMHGQGDYQGYSVAGGIVYRGPVEALQDMYIFADSVSGNIWGINLDDIPNFNPARPSDTLVWLNEDFKPADGSSFTSIVSFGEDAEGNLYIVDMGSDPAGLGGNIYRVDPGPGPIDLILNVASGTQTQADAGRTIIDSVLSVTKTGAGTLVFNAANPYTGPTSVAAGTLVIQNSQAISASPATVNTGATLAVASGVTMHTPSVTLEGGRLIAPSLAVNATTGIGVLTLNSGTISGTAVMTVGAGGSVTLPSDARFAAGVARLAVDETSGGGLIDLGAGQLAIAAGGISEADLRDDLIAGRNGGAWNGATGIASAAAAASGGTRSVGYVVGNDGGVRVSYAAFGDTDLNGATDVFDLVAINSSGTYGTGIASSWSQGDFNYDHVTNVFDLVSVNSGGAYGAGNYFPTAATPPVLTAVPEPRSLVWLAAAGLALAGIGGRSRQRLPCRKCL